MSCLLGKKQQVIVFELDPSRDISVPCFLESFSEFMCAGRNEFVSVTQDTFNLGKIFLNEGKELQFKWFLRKNNICKKD